jgi:hypothetical protein
VSATTTAAVVRAARGSAWIPNPTSTTVEAAETTVGTRQTRAALGLASADPARRVSSLRFASSVTACSDGEGLGGASPFLRGVRHRAEATVHT